MLVKTQPLCGGTERIRDKKKMCALICVAVSIEGLLCGKYWDCVDLEIQ